jgi:hypothetical protein
MEVPCFFCYLLFGVARVDGCSYSLPSMTEMGGGSERNKPRSRGLHNMNHQAIVGTCDQAPVTSYWSGARCLPKAHRGRFSDVTLLACQMVKGLGALSSTVWTPPGKQMTRFTARAAKWGQKVNGFHHRLPRKQVQRTQQDLTTG